MDGVRWGFWEEVSLGAWGPEIGVGTGGDKGREVWRMVDCLMRAKFFLTWLIDSHEMELVCINRANALSMFFPLVLPFLYN